MKRSQHQNENISASFAAALRRARGTRSQAEFARLLGIPSQTTYQRYEAGRVPSGDILYQMANRLGVTIEELLTGGKPETSLAVKTEEGAIALPWGFEIEEDIQITKVLGTICEIMTPTQLLYLVKFVADNPRLTPKAKGFWKRMFGEWATVKLEAEIFAKLSPDQKIAHLKEEEGRKREAWMRHFPGKAFPANTTEARPPERGSHEAEPTPKKRGKGGK